MNVNEWDKAHTHMCVHRHLTWTMAASSRGGCKSSRSNREMRNIKSGNCFCLFFNYCASASENCGSCILLSTFYHFRCTRNKKNVCSLKFISFLVRFTSVLSFHMYVAIKILASYKNDIIGLRNARKKENLQFMWEHKCWKNC